MEFIKLRECRKQIFCNIYSPRYKYDKFCQHIKYYDSFLYKNTFKPKFDLTNVKSNIVLLSCNNELEIIVSDEILKIYLSQKTKILWMLDNFRMKIKICSSSSNLIVFTTKRTLCNKNPTPKGVTIIYLF